MNIANRDASNATGENTGRWRERAVLYLSSMRQRRVEPAKRE
jgi:hypothetical protein